MPCLFLASWGVVAAHEHAEMTCPTVTILYTGTALNCIQLLSRLARSLFELFWCVSLFLAAREVQAYLKRI